MIPFLHGALGVAGYASAFELIDTQTVGAGGTASISFSSIPQTYKHLQIRCIEQGASDVVATFNNDTGSNYFSYHQVRGDGASAGSQSAGALTAFWYLGIAPSATNFGAAVADILDYTSTTKNKTIRQLAGYDANGSGYILLRSSLWMPSTIAAISSIQIKLQGGQNINQFSTFSLYGVK